MPLTTLDAHPASQAPEQAEMLAALRELQRMKTIVITGGAAGGGGVTATGLATADHIVSVIRQHKVTAAFVTASGSPDTTANAVTDVTLTDVTAEATIPTADHLRLASTDTTGDKLIVTYHDVA